MLKYYYIIYGLWKIMNKNNFIYYQRDDIIF